MKRILVICLFFCLHSYAENDCFDYVFSYEKNNFSICKEKRDSLKVYDIKGTKIRVFDYGSWMYFVGLFEEIADVFSKIGFQRKQNKGKKSDDLFEYSYRKIEASNMSFLLTTVDGLNNLPSDVVYEQNEVVFKIQKQIVSRKRKIILLK